MAFSNAHSQAIDPAAENGPAPSRSRPIDLVHLARQTLGDAELEREILSMFLRQALWVRESMAGADDGERRRLAHGLIGSARGVGAFTLAECAAEIENRPLHAEAVERLARLIDDVHAFLGDLGG